MVDDDDKKNRPRRPRPQGDAPGRDGPPRREGAAAKPFRKPEGGKPAYRPRRDAASDAEGAARPKREWKPREAGAGEGAKPFRKSFGDKPFRKPAGGKPGYGPRRDAAAEGAERPRREWKPRDAGTSQDAKPFRKRNDGAFRQADGDRPFRKPEGGKPAYRARRDEGAGAAGAGERPFRKRNEGERAFGSEGGDRSYRKPQGDKPSYRPRRDEDPRTQGADRPKREWKPRDGGGAPRGGEGKPFREGRSFRQDRSPAGDGGRRFDKPSFAKGPGADRPARKPRGADSGAEKPNAAVEAGERIAKRLARAGISSRREAEAMIAAGRISMNGQVLTSPAVNVTARDTILVDNQPLPAIERTRVFLFHKPAGVVTTNRDPEGRPTIFDVLPEGLPRLITVGRLDINTEGLLLLTNDGGLARVLELPATGWLRRYRARVHGKVDEKALASLKDGIAVDGVFYGSIDAALDREQGSNAWLTLGLREGKNREVKNVLGALGLDVSRLIRVSFGPFQLGELEEGAVQELKGRTLRDQLGERLIEEAGADFEAPVAAEFPNRPVTRGNEPAPKAARPRYEEPGEGGLVRNRKRERENRREDALGRLQTKPAGRGGQPAGRKERAERPFEPPRSRSSNVWMAPGARPQGKKDETEAPASARSSSEGEGQHRRFDKKRGPADRPAEGDRPRKPRKDR